MSASSTRPVLRSRGSRKPPSASPANTSATVKARRYRRGSRSAEGGCCVSRAHLITPDRTRQPSRKPRKERRRRRGRPRLGGTTQPGAADRLSVADANASAAKGGVMRCALSLGGFLLGLLGLGGGFLLRGGGFLLCRGLLLRRRGRSVGVLLLEAVDAPLRVDQLLLPGEERVAIAADVEVQVAVRRPRLPGRAARAVHLGGRVGRVDVLAHVLSRKGCE